MFGPPEEINVDKIQELMNNKYQDQMGERSASIMDPNSALNQALKQQLTQSVDQSTYTQNRLNKQNFAQSGMSGQSGIQAQLAERGQATATGQVSDHWKNMVQNNMQQSNQLLTGAAGLEQKTGDTMASAYGQNITNSNNYKAALAGNVMQAGALVMCDARVKKDIKQVGRVKTKSGKSVGLFNFKYKWADKDVTGVMAQDVERKHPKAVKKGKNGLKFVDMKELFG